MRLSEVIDDLYDRVLEIQGVNGVENEEHEDDEGDYIEDDE